MKPYTNFCEVLEGKAWDQFCDAMKQDFVVRGALMPDAHAGYSLPIGAVVATDSFVVPAWVGYDIGCGMCALRTRHDANDVREHAQDIFGQIYRSVPVGFDHNEKDVDWAQQPFPIYTSMLKNLFENGGRKQLATLGGGNHFIEIGVDEEDQVWVVIHSGSRNIGHKTATHYMKLASGDGKAREGHFGFHSDSDLGIQYYADMSFCLEFALENRRQILGRVLNVLDHFAGHSDAWAGELINRNHNHIDRRDGLWVHRKGATHAEKGMMGIIPGNMRDGSFIVEGKGNPDALWSSSHGAGRTMGRKVAKETLSLEEFQETMTGIQALVKPATLDESPMAYKDIFEVMRLQEPLVTVKAHVRPIINIKG